MKTITHAELRIAPSHVFTEEYHIYFPWKVDVELILQWNCTEHLAGCEAHEEVNDLTLPDA
jgi:hypothetical protein